MSDTVNVVEKHVAILCDRETGRVLNKHERAVRRAQEWHEKHGVWPSVRKLADVAGAGRGTAARALNQLRAT
jgi:hypothetical protein